MSIPKHFHFIWMGEPVLPSEYLGNVQKWASLHPDWTVQIWTDVTIREFLLDHGYFEETQMMSKLDSYAAKSDIFRLVLLAELGGVYMDCDMQPVRSIDALAAAVESGCFVGWEHPGHMINNAAMGAIRQHPAVLDALAALRGHLEDPATNKKDAAYATGPFFLNELWIYDDRVSKLPKEVFYPYDWHEPWKAGWTPGPDTVAIHRWHASWIGETQRQAKALPPGRTIALFRCGDTDAARRNLVSQSVLQQSVKWSDHFWERGLKEMLQPHVLQNQLHQAHVRRVHRVLFAPGDHVLDRNCAAVHGWLPPDVIGVSAHRLFSSLKMFELTRKSDVFPFEVFKYHGCDVKALPEVFSAPTWLALKTVTEKFEEIRYAGSWRVFCQNMIDFMTKRPAFTYRTKTTKLCQHPVNENAGDQHVPQWDGKEIIAPK